MTADVNVIEKAAWLVFEDQERHRGVGGQVVRSIEPIHYRVARAALSALADPEVLAGIADRLDQHIPCEDGCGLCICDPDAPWTPQHQAAELVDWLTGGAL